MPNNWLPKNFNTMISDEEIVRLTQYSHGAGCGCKISPKVLDEILAGTIAMPDNKNLLVGRPYRQKFN